VRQRATAALQPVSHLIPYDSAMDDKPPDRSLLQATRGRIKPCLLPSVLRGVMLHNIQREVPTSKGTAERQRVDTEFDETRLSCNLCGIGGLDAEPVGSYKFTRTPTAFSHSSTSPDPCSRPQRGTSYMTAHPSCMMYHTDAEGIVSHVIKGKPPTLRSSVVRQYTTDRS
jgi:hypothetical protein